MVHKLVVNNRRFRSILSLVVALLLIGLTSYIGVQTYRPGQAATERSMYLTPDVASVRPGDTLSVTVRANSGSTPVNSVQASLVYDTARLQYSGLTEGTAFPTVAATSTNEPGVIRVGRAAQDTPVTGDNAVVTINFKVLSTGGSAAVSLEKAYSMLVTSADSQDILQQVQGGSFTVTAPTTTPPPATSPPPASPTPPPVTNPSDRPILYLNPGDGNYKSGDTLTVAVRVNTGGAGLTTIQSVLRYPTDKLQYVSTSDEGSAFATKQRTTAKDGAVDIIRGIAGGSAAITGDQLVATVTFKVVGTNGSAPLVFAPATAAYDASGTGQNILNLSGSRAATYTIGAAGGAQAGNPPAGPKSSTLTTSSQTMTVKTNGSGRASVAKAVDGSLLTELSGDVELSPIIDQALFAANPGETVAKVEYYLNGRLMSTQTEAPYAYKFNTTDMRNGVYSLDIRTYYGTGRVDSRTEMLRVNNEIDLAYVARHYLLRALTTFVILLVLALAIWKFVIPRFPRGNSAADGSHGNGHQTVFGPINSGPVAGDPVVVAPVGAAGVAGGLSSFGAAAPVFAATPPAQSTQALPITPVTVTPLVGSSPESQPLQQASTAAPLIRPSASTTEPAAPAASSSTPASVAPAVISPAPPAAATVSSTSGEAASTPRPTNTADTTSPASSQSSNVQPSPVSKPPQAKYADPSFQRPRRSFIGDSPVKQPAFASAASDLSSEPSRDAHDDPYHATGDRRGY